MKLTVASKAWHDTLKPCCAVLPGKSTHPAYGVLLLEAKEDGLYVTATDGEQRLTLGCAAQVHEPGSLCLAGAALQGATAPMRDIITVNASVTKAEISDGQGEYVAPAVAVAYPISDQGLQPVCRFRMPGDTLAQLLSVIGPSLPDPEAVALKASDGAVFDLDGSNLAVVSSTQRSMVLGHAVVAVDERTPHKDKGLDPARFVATMSVKSIGTAVNVLKGLPEVEVVFTQGRGHLMGPAVDFTFPLTQYARHIPWRGNQLMIPDEGACKLLVQADEFRQAVARVVAVIRDDAQTKSIHLTAGDGKITLESQGQGGSGSALCDCTEFHGNPVRLRIDGRLLLAHLKFWDKEPLRLIVTDNRVRLTQGNVDTLIARMED